MVVTKTPGDIKGLAGSLLTRYFVPTRLLYIYFGFMLTRRRAKTR